MFAEGTELIRRRSRELAEPKSYYTGSRLPETFSLPDNILLFYHDFCARFPVSHSRYTLVFPLGRMHYCIDQQEFDIAEGELLIIPPHASRFLSPRSGSYRRFFITFELPEKQAYLPQGIVHRLSENSVKYLQILFDLFPDGDPVELSLALYGLLTTLASPCVSAAPKHLSREITDAAEFIHGKIHTPLTCGEIASRVNMSPGNFSRRFKKETGIPLYEYISLQRLESARYYLQKSDMTMEEIAVRCGFLSSSSFSHFFSRRTGESPQMYRKKHR